MTRQCTISRPPKKFYVTSNLLHSFYFRILRTWSVLLLEIWTYHSFNSGSALELLSPSYYCCFCALNSKDFWYPIALKLCGLFVFSFAVVFFLLATFCSFPPVFTYLPCVVPFRHIKLNDLKIYYEMNEINEVMPRRHPFWLGIFSSALDCFSIPFCSAYYAWRGCNVFICSLLV